MSASIDDLAIWADAEPRKSRKGGFQRTVGIGIVAAMLVSGFALAGFISYYNEVNTHLNVQQGIMIDGHPMGEPITHTVEEAYGGCCYCFEHTVTNDGCEGQWLQWNHYENGSLVPPDSYDNESFGYEVLMAEGGGCGNIYLGHLDISVLDGIAEWDDFEVYVDGQLVYTYSAIGGENETWILHVIDLLPFSILADGTHTVTINCTAGEPWQYFNPYGELAVDTIELYCELETLCDSVDIGKPASEAGHNPLGWGPIEPATSGGAYGGIDDCRTTWFYTSGDVLPQNGWTTADAPWASVELTCDIPGGEGCNCDNVIEEPFYLDANESMTFCLCYNLHPLIEPGQLTIHSELRPVI